MILSTAAINALQVSFSTIFESAYGTTPTWYQEVASVIPSTTYAANYGWMTKALGRMREWVGPKVINNLVAKSYSIANRDYELTWGVRRNDILDDQLGLFNDVVSGYTQQAARLWNDLTIDILAGSTVTTGPGGAAVDGLAFFANHTGAGGFPVANNTGTEELSPVGWNAVVEKMAAFTDEGGRPMGIRPDTLVIPAVGGFERAARMMFSALLATGGASNTLLTGAPKIIVVPELPDGHWYALDTSKGLKPFIVQVRQSPTLAQKTAPTDDNVFYLGEFLWSIEARGAAGYGPYWLAYHSASTTPDGREVPAVAGP